MENKVGVYFKVFGLANNTKTGEKAYAGVSLEFTTQKENPEAICQELFEKFNNDEGKQALLNQSFLADSHTIDDVIVVTKEEYYRDYGNDESEDD